MGLTHPLLRCRIKVSGALLYIARSGMVYPTSFLLTPYGRRNLIGVASNVGGISELIDNSTGWLVREVHNPAAYIAALNMIAIDPEEAHRRSQALRSRVRFRHSWEKYIQAISTSPSFLD